MNLIIGLLFAIGVMLGLIAVVLLQISENIVKALKNLEPLVQWKAEMDPMLKDLLRGYEPPNFIADKLFFSVPEHI